MPVANDSLDSSQMCGGMRSDGQGKLLEAKDKILSMNEDLRACMLMYTVL